MSTKKENKFKSELADEIEKRFPGSIVAHLDPCEIQGIPDLLVLYKDKWVTLEGKKDKNAHHQPNQDFYVNKMNEMSFSRFIYPENKDEVLNEMERLFESGR